ncbi:hypothetical protein N7468_006918 [Penicillium chermesinum]|uniref:xyloglucan-specific endo-beta-1,4-glucanase n=1 Tax=Penicillium chermesinum TaxID=63820 RepID=A0A9W9TK51_9EURO|nr:uncharacterized protein N7468_006918 [Penicillium chermesinum]KAJ5225693.1 hypothetical protein N7468_006918 [Penicillium chermesinum]
MAFRLLVNTSLLAIPIGGAIGTLLGIDASRSAAGKPPLFTGDSNSNVGSGGSGGGSSGGGDSTGGGSGGHGTTTNDGVTNTEYCYKAYGISPPSDGNHYTLNPNQWGVTGDTTPTSFLCMNVTTFNNETYATKQTAPAFSATWQYPQGPETQPVHAYPNINLDDVVPVSLDSVQEINLDFTWTYNVGNTPALTSPPGLLENDNPQDLVTNVAFDMFFDADKQTATNSSTAKHEVMVWFAMIGLGAQPIAYNNNHPTHTMEVDGVEFDLFAGTNGEGQNVFTWKTSTNRENFTGDIYPLIEYLYEQDGDKYPSKTDYMGVFQFGSEAYSASDNVTFSVPKLTIDIKT